MSIIERERAEEVTREATEADVLERAADLIEETGWCQFSYRGSGSLDIIPKRRFELAEEYCVTGAIFQAAYDAGTGAIPARDVLSDFLGQGATSWNDAPERTKAEVVAKLREAAARAREEA